LAPAIDGGAWILDRVNKFYWKLDRRLRIRPAGHNEAISPATPPIFQPADGSPIASSGVTGEIPLDISLAASIAAADPVAIEALSDGSVMILDNLPGANYSNLLCYGAGVSIGPPLSLSGVLQPYVSVLDSAEANELSDSVRGHDIAFVAASSPALSSVLGELFVASADGDQSFAFDVSKTGAGYSLTLAERFYPMRFYSGKALLADSGVVYYDSADRWNRLAEQPRPRFATSASLPLPPPRSVTDAIAGTSAFDGKLPGCVWHRLLLDACIPPGTQVTVESRAADIQKALPNLPWQPEPSPYLRDDGSEVPFYQAPLRGLSGHTGTWELLFQQAVGRYLQLRITLSGPGSNSPRIQALRAYYPRFSYMKKYLPSAYQDDATSASFLDRFLANVEGFFTVDEGRIEHTPTLFDTRTVGFEYMDWLASWLGLTLDLSWDERKRRLFLSHAPQYYRERGTRAGLERSIRLTLEPCPDDSLFDASTCSCVSCTAQANRSAFFTVRIVEKFLTRQPPGISFSSGQDISGPGAADPSAGWNAGFGAETVNKDFRNFLSSLYPTIDALNSQWGASYTGFDDPGLKFFAIAPANKAQSQDWQTFINRQLAFTYTPPNSGDLKLYQNFLRGRYQTVLALNARYQLSGAELITSFGSISFPPFLPSGGQMLEDWLEFVSSVLPTQRFAHQFSVLVPIQLGDDEASQALKMDIARRVAEIEKPAHTSFDVQPYWAFFRVGTARVEIDTLLGRGSRFSALLLGRDSLASGYLSYVEPWNVSDRVVLGGTKANTCCTVQPQARCV
jgi:phage tail-like protein